MRVSAVIGIYVAGIIGAGFASGQELYIFFVSYGWGGLIGLGVAVLILTFGSFIILEFAARHKVQSYNELFSHLGFKRTLIFDIIYSIFLITGVSVMLAGCGALSSNGIGRLFLQTGTALLVFASVYRGVGGPLQDSKWLAGVIVGVLSLLALSSLFKGTIIIPQKGSLQGIEAGILYASYNLGFSMAILSSIPYYLKARNERLLVAIIGNGVLALSMFMLCLSMNNLTEMQLSEPFPLINIVQNGNRFLSLIYYIIIWCAMYTTAIANSLALVKRITINSLISWQHGTAFIVIISYFLSFFGFTKLIQLAYPLLGMLALFFLILIGRSYLCKT